MKKVLAALLILVTTLSVMQLNVSNANPYTKIPSLSFLSPNPSWVRCYSNASVPVKIGILFSNTSDTRNYVPHVFYSLDQGENITFTNITKGEHWAKEYPMQPPLSFTANTTLCNLAEGNHTLNVYTFDVKGNLLSDELTFVVDSSYKSPEFTLISPKKINYTSSEVQLVFWTNKEYKDARYILDYHLNSSARYIHFNGNTTLTNLGNGTHKIIVFADCYDEYYDGISLAQGTSFNVSVNENAITNVQKDLPADYKPTNMTTATIAVIVAISSIVLGYLIIKKKQPSKT